MSNLTYFALCGICVAAVLLGINMMSKVKTAVQGNGLSAVAMIFAMALIFFLRVRAADISDIAAICAAPTVLGRLGILKARRATCYPGCEDGMGDAVMIPGAAAVTDGKLTTGTSAGCAIPFGLELIKQLKGEHEAERIRKQIVIR